MAARVRARLSAGDGRKFAFTVGGAFLVLAGLLWWRGTRTTSTVLQILGGLLILAGLVLPTHLGPVQRGWMAGAQAISRVTTPIVLGIIYFVVITPAGLVLRLLGHKPIARPAGAATYWVTREPKPKNLEHMQHQY